MLGKCRPGLVAAVIVLVATVWSGATSTSLTNEELTGVHVALYEPQGSGDDRTGPGRDRKNGTGPGRGDWPGTGPSWPLPPVSGSSPKA